MTGVEKLARKMKSMENYAPYTPMLGEIISLPELKIQCGDKVTLESSDIHATFDVYETQENDDVTEYVNLNKTVVLLPCYNLSGNATKFIVIGVVQ